VKKHKSRMEIIRTLEQRTSFAIACHENPDGDAIGSVLALSLALMQMDKQVQALCPDPVPQRYRFLPHWELVSTAAPARPPEVGIALDCDGSGRLRTMESVICGADVVVDIDHHVSEHVFGDLVLVDPDAPATCEIILNLLHDLPVRLTESIATCLFCGLGTDTGFFRFQNTSARAFKAAAVLVEAGAVPSVIAQQAYVSKSPSALALLGRALAGIRCLADGTIAVATLSRRDFEETGAAPEETEGIIDHLKACEGVRVAMLLSEQMSSDGVRCSLRATDETDVGAIAESHGGGGHRAAAGCTLPALTLTQAESILVPEILKALGR